jgi:tetratricopeptide (TPR) repeat protein
MPAKYPMTERNIKLNSKPLHQALFNRPMLAKSSQDWYWAEKNCLKLLHTNPQDTEVLTFLASAYLKLNQYNQCIERASQSIKIAPQSADAYAILAEAYFKQGQLTYGLDACVHAIDLNEDCFEAWQTRGLILQNQKKFSQAIQCFNKALDINHNDEGAYVNCGNCLNEMEKFEFALAHHNFALELNENSLAALNSKAIALLNLHRYEEALASINRVLTLAPSLTASLLNRGNIFAALGKQQNAISDYQKVIKLQPDYAMAYCNLANLYLDLQNVEAAKTHYLKALEIEPNNDTIQWNAALFLLLMGDYTRGWQCYEAGRTAKTSIRPALRACPQPFWLGQESVNRKRILITHEQGYGDTIQFIRYASLVEELGATVILELPSNLAGLIQHSYPNFQVVSFNQPFTDFDYHTSMMSLPLAFKTTLSTIPANIPYLFAQKEKVKKFNIAHINQINIGLVWSGSTIHHNDANRSIALEQLRPLLDINANLHCLQKEIRDSDYLALPDFPNINIYADQLRDFSDTAALVDAMDLIISVDTSVAHLAGAMGKPVWILLPSTPDFRWMLNTEDSPWYPTARLFRQDGAGKWDSVIQTIIETFHEVYPDQK